MKRKLICAALVLSMLAMLCACGNTAPAGEGGSITAAVSTEGGTVEATVSPEGPEENTAAEEAGSAETDAVDGAAADFSYAQLEGKEFCFMSGAGGWATFMYVEPDGSFHGSFHDSEMGEFAEGYSGGTVYMSNFRGTLSEPVKVSDYSWSAQVTSLEYEQELDSEEILDQVRYVYTTSYGISNGDTLVFYLAGAPIAELPEEFMMWVGYTNPAAASADVLNTSGIYNETGGYGFVCDDPTLFAAQLLKDADAAAEELQYSIDHDDLTQQEYNEKSAALYELWDNAINGVWEQLQQNIEPDTMKTITKDEVEWIAEKDEAMKAAGAEYEGGSMQGMVMNIKGAELTRARAYALLEMFRTWYNG